MRPIDADELHNDLKKQPKWVVKREGFINEGYSYDQVHFTIDKMPTAEPTEEQVKEYCRKQNLVVVDRELFNEMKTMWSSVPVVRCKDCKYGEPNGQHGCKCYHYKLYETHEMSPNDFCSRAERREDE